MDSRRPRYTMESEDTMDSVDESLKTLLRGEVLPLQEVDASYIPEEHRKSVPLFTPKVKKNIAYIVMAVLFDDDDRVVLVQEAKSSCKGSWYLPAGRVEKGENLLDAARREVLEEAGLQFEPISFIDASMLSRWCRFVYVGKSIGGKLKTLAEKDSESLQAGWFTIEQIEAQFVKLRAKDILKPIRLAYEYMKKTEENRHPSSSIVVQPHAHLIHRPVIYKQSKDGSVMVLCCTKNGLHLPSCYISPENNSFSESVFSLVFSAFQVAFLKHILVKGLLTVEHCGIPAGEHDGICFTTAMSFTSENNPRCIETPANSEFAWCPITDSTLLSDFQTRIIDNNLTVPINYVG